MAREKILVKVPNWIGDAVMALPALEALKALYPLSEISVLARPKVVPVFERNPAVGRLIALDNKRHSGIFGKLRLSSELKGSGFDLAVLFQNAFGAALISFLAAARERVGYSRDMRSGFLTRAIPVTDEIKKVHHVIYYLNIIKELGARVPESPCPRIYLSSEERGAASRFLDEKGLSGGPVFGAAPGASFGPAKRWPAERFAAVLRGLVDEYGGGALVFGGPEDKEACAAVKAAMPEAHDLSGGLSLRESMALMAVTSAFITNDSGPMHISAALGAPTVAIFGSTEDALTGPIGKKTAVVRRKTQCSPCFKRECRYGHYDCLAKIEAKEVQARAMEIIG